jgi:hypothetical protein
MADNLKHVGRLSTTGRKVVVAYRTLPGESDSALVVQTEALSDEQHDSLIRLVESNAGQNSYEFAEAMARERFPTGEVMLTYLHQQGKLTKVKTSSVLMTPNMQATIVLDQLNQMIAEQQGISVNDLALGNSTKIQDVAQVNEVAPPVSEKVEQPAFETKPADQPLSDDDIARNLRSQADALYKEAAKLRAQAEELAPTKKKATVKAE